MDIKELGVCGVVVIGGTVFGVSKMGLGAALSEDLKAYHEVASEDRADYMGSIVVEFRDSFDTYIVQTESYDYVGTSTFSFDPELGLFVEVVKQDDTVPSSALPEIRKRLTKEAFCAQDEMTMFTENGWNYSFTLKHKKTRNITTVICQPKQAGGTA